MKVRITKDSKKVLTLEEAKVAQEIIKYFKEEEEESVLNEYVKLAISAAYQRLYGVFNQIGIVVLESSAEISKNRRAWNCYNDHSGTLDVWIKATAFVDGYEFIRIEAYLSDICNICASDVYGNSNCEEIASHMYVRRFKECK